MHTRHASHPTLQELAAFALGKLPEAGAALVVSHLAVCTDCAQAVKQTPADSFVALLNQARPGAASSSSVPPGRTLGHLAPLADTPDLPPELVQHPKFQIVRRLGQGGMGTVYHAKHKVMDRDIALKVINPSFLEHPAALPRFFSEVKAAAKLDHPNIVRAYDAEPAGGLQLFVMEYVEGRSLAQVLESKGTLPVAHACHYIRQAALGLQHAYEQGMVHRDIKPANLMLTPKGKVKVLDFGLARLASEQGKGLGLTQVNAFMGTPEYVAPEQAMDARQADIRADLYSLGCTLYCLLVGRPPFQGDTVMQIVMAQIEKEAPPVRELRPEVPVELSALVARLLAKDPAKRYQKPVELAQALAPFCKPGQPSGPGQAPPPPPGLQSVRAGTMNATGGMPSLRDVTPQAAAREAAVSPPPLPAGAAAFEALEDPGADPMKGKRRAEAEPRQTALRRRWQILGGAAAGVVVLTLGAWLLAGVIFKTKVQTADGEAIIVVEVDQPGAEVLVDGGKIRVTVPGDKQPVEISVPPGKHTLEVKKGGFVVNSREIELKTGKSDAIRVRLEPLPAAPEKTGSQPTPVADRLPPLPPPSAALEALRRDMIPPEALALAGDGDANKAPASLVAVLGEAQPIHSQEVLGLAYSPDGLWLASGSVDKTIMLRDTATGRVQRILQGHTGTVSAVSFSKDGRTLVSAGHDGSLRLWSVDKEEKPTIVDARLGQPVVQAMAVSPDGRFVAVGGESGLIQLWKWGAWEKPIEFPALSGNVKILSLAFSPDGELLACGGVKGEKEEAARVYIYATADGAAKGSMMLNPPFGPGEKPGITALSFSHDGKQLAAVGGDANGRVWEVASGKPVKEIAWPGIAGEYQHHAGSVAWSPDDKTLAVGANWRVIVHDLSSGAKQTLWVGVERQGMLVRALTFSPHGNMLAASNFFGDVQVWDTTKGKRKYLERGHRHYVSSVAISPNGRELLSLGDEPALLRWQLAHPLDPVERNLSLRELMRPLPYSVSYNPDGDTFIIPAHSQIAVESTLTEKKAVIRTDPLFLQDPAVSPEGRIVAGAGHDGFVHLWDLSLGREVHRFPASVAGGGCPGSAFSSDGKFLAVSAEVKKRMTIWNVATGAETCSWEVKSLTKASAFHPQGNVLATGHDDGSILLWDTATGQMKRTLASHSAPIRSLKFTPDGKTLVSSGNDGIIRMCNPEHMRAREIIPLGPANRPLTFVLDASGKYLFAAGHSPVIFVLRLPSNAE